MTKVLFSAGKDDWAKYRDVLPAALAEAGVSADIGPDILPEEAEYIVYSPASMLQDFSVFPRLKAVLNLWAGVEEVVGNRTLQVPLARMSDTGLRQGMIEYVLCHCLIHHLGQHGVLGKQDGIWRHAPPPLASERTVAVLGLGELGQAVADALRDVGFNVTGWSRRAKSLDGIETHAGDDGLRNVLSGADILVLLLPQTSETTNIIDAEALALLPDGAALINPGRGPLIDDDAVIAALDSGRLAHATLDVFRKEPLPKDHPFWAHPKVTVTPHIAASTRPASASRVIAENIRRGENSEDFMLLVDRKSGY